MFLVHVWLLCCLFSAAADHSGISQPASVQSVKLGDPATIPCHIQGYFYIRVWYRLTSAKTLQFVANFNSRQVEMSEDLVGRYSVEAHGINNHLKISRTTWTDVGTYYCGVIDNDRVQFGRGTSLMLEGAKMSSDTLEQPPVTQVHPGDSGPLECSVQGEHCKSKHSNVTWLKIPNSTRSDASHCMEDSCVYKLLLKNLSSEDAGTFYCVAAACGQVLLGGGTELNFTRTAPEVTEGKQSPLLLALIVYNMICGIFTLSFIWRLSR